MRYTFSLLALILLVRGVRADEPLNTKAVDGFVREAMKSWQVPGAALAIVRDGEVVYLQSYGVRTAGSQDAVTPDTLFAIGSCTKAFTAAAIGVLVDEGKMAWDDPVRKHLPWFRLSDPLADRDVTLRDLLCHRTGLAGHDVLWFGAALGRDEVVRRMAHVPPAHPFRSSFFYNNIMYVAAGQTVGAAVQGSWDDFVEQRLFAPLGMRRATCRAQRALADSDHALPHQSTKDGKVEVLPWHADIDNAGPAGSIHASVRDMAQWVRFQLGDGTFEGKRILAVATLAETHTPQMTVRVEGALKIALPETEQAAYGLGWFIHDHRGRFLISHTGGMNGFRARIVLVPKAKLGLVLLMNSGVGSSYASMHYAVTNQLLDVLLGLPKQDWDRRYTEAYRKQRDDAAAGLAEFERHRQLDTKPSRELAAYTGTYTDTAYGPAMVTLKDGTLFLEWGRSKLRLAHFHYDTFILRPVKAEEHHPLDHEPAGFVLRTDGVVGTLNLFGREFKRSEK
jgi:CubicO group peptidase (beta-lactamase class C family)